MKKILPAAFVFFMLCTGRIFAADACGNTATNDDQLITAQAQELVKGKTTRLEKVSAIHSYVRDQIGQSKTQYG